MPRINPLLFIVVLFIAGFVAAYSIRFTPGGSFSQGRPLVGGPFSLTGTDGKRVTDRDFRGRLMLVFFGYTHCPDVCPTELQNMTDVLAKLGPDAKKIAPIFVSVDPARDTPQDIADYVSNFSPQIIGLTGTRDEVVSVAKAYRVYYKKVGSDPASYAVDHSAFVYLMDRNGNYITHFLFNTPPDTVLKEINKYISG
jgi:protein SCO1/2